MEITRKAALISFAASIIILVIKYVAFLQTGSAAVLSDALESIVNVLAAGVAFAVMRAVAEPADDEHPYGHGKLEYFSATFEGGLITFAGLIIAREAYIAFAEGRAPRNLDLGLLISAFAGLCNLAVGFYILKTGKKAKSEALIASGHHILSDVWSTVGTLAGLLLVKLTGISWFDPVAALIIGLNLAYAGYKIVRRSAGALIDETEPKTIRELAQAFGKNRRPGVIDIHLVKLIRSGSFHHIDAHLVVPEFWSILETHDLMDKFEEDVVSTYPFDGEINFHLDPCFRDYCSICDLPDCPIRQKEFVAHREFNLETLVQRPDRSSMHESD